MKQSTVDRFWLSVHCTAEDKCWPWLGRLWHGGPYGCVVLEGRWYLAHRAAYLIGHGHLDPSLDVLHGCDNPVCCNWRRCLRQGTHVENMAEMADRGRARNGYQTGNRGAHMKVPPALLDAIVADYERGVPMMKLARDHGITPSALRGRLQRIGKYIPRERGTGRLINTPVDAERTG
jgi:hypothetical protein